MKTKIPLLYKRQLYRNKKLKMQLILTNILLLTLSIQNKIITELCKRSMFKSEYINVQKKQTETNL